MADRSSGYGDNWQIDKSLVQCNLHMLTTRNSCDVVFLVGPDFTPISAHSYVLISRSCVFHALLSGPPAEKDPIKVLGTSEKIFRDFLTFLYTDNTEMTLDNLSGLMYLAKKYSVGCLEKLCISYRESLQQY